MLYPAVDGRGAKPALRDHDRGAGDSVGFDPPSLFLRPGGILPSVGANVPRVRRFQSVEELLQDARSRLTRVSPAEAAAAVPGGAGLVDIRPQWQRAAEGEIPGSIVVERNHLEWRLHPTSSARLADATPGRRWIVVCSQGYTSSLAADALNSIGVPATDIVGGFEAWAAAGLATCAGGRAPDSPDSAMPPT